jgi:carboxyl-terminal processing protease
VADLFFAAGKPLGSLRDRRQTVKEYVSTGDPSDNFVPLVVLTTVGTSGPAELLAAALKDGARAQIVGEKTSGTASLQQPMELEDGALLILTTELFYGPAGNPIQHDNVKKSGVQPSEKVPDDSFITAFYYQNPSLSNEEQYNRLLAEVEKLQLQRAVEILKKSLKKAA